VKQVQSGIAPQLALETAMLASTGFPDIAARAIAPPVVVKLGAGREGCREVIMAFEGMSAAEAAGQALARLKALIDRFEAEETPYVSLLHPMFKGRRYGDYDHLARVREWSLASEEGADA
jgi:ATP-dependent helicase/nuclease subunit B